MSSRPEDGPAGLEGIAREIVESVRAALEVADSRDARLRRVVAILSRSNPHFSWTGIYLLEGDTLVLHNQVGPPTPHERIPVGRGICGLAARERRTVVVPDVSKDPRYLACSLSTRSEIVVPIFRGDAVIGEIDVDSDRPDAFGNEDRRVLEETARLIAAVA